jgi:hypothetical protein
MAIDPITAALEAGKTLVERIWPNPADQAKAKLELEKIAQNGDLAEINAQVTLLAGQLEINKIEANSNSLFVSGWRPSIGWTCAAAFAYKYVVYEILLWVFGVIGAFSETAIPAPPSPNMVEMMPVLLGMLGLGALRTREKEKGVARDN